MEENINLLDSYYLGVVEKDLREKSNGAKILNDNQIDNYEMLGIDKDKDAGVINLQYKDEKQKEADGMSFAEGLLEFAKDIPSSSIYSVGLAGVNGADVMVNFIPLFDKLFSLDPNYRSNDNLMKKMQDWDKNLANARKFLNDKRDQNQKVSQFVGMVFQDVPYAIPLHKAFKKAGMPTWMSMPLAFGVGYGLGFDEKHVSMFLNSKDMRAIKDFVKIMPDTPEDKLFDNMYQMFEGTAFAGILPQVWQGIKFAKRNIPKVANALNTEQVGATIAGGTTAAVVGSTEAKSLNNNVVKKSFNKQEMQKLVSDAEAKNESIIFYDEATMTESGPNDAINDYIVIKDKKALKPGGVVFFDRDTNTQMTYQKKGETDDDYIKLLSTSQRAKADSSSDSIGSNSIAKQTKN